MYSSEFLHYFWRILNISSLNTTHLHNDSGSPLDQLVGSSTSLSFPLFIHGILTHLLRAPICLISDMTRECFMTIICVDWHPSQTHRQLASAHRTLFWKLTILAESQYWLANLFSLWWALLWTLYFSLPVSRAQQQKQLSHVFRNEMNNMSIKYFNLVYRKKYFKCFTTMIMTVMTMDWLYFTFYFHNNNPL